MSSNPSLMNAVLIALIIGIIAHWKMTKSTFWSWVALGTTMFMVCAHFVVGEIMWAMLWLFITAMDSLYLFYVRPRRELEEQNNVPEV